MSRPWEVLLPTQIDPAGPESIADIARCTGMDEYDSVGDALEDIGRYDAVIVRVAELTAEVLGRADRLQVIAKHGAGLDNVDIAAASERNIVVCNTPGVNARSVAEHAIALLFGVRRNLHTADRHVRDGGWDRGAFAGHELAGDSLGLMGYGSIAQETAAIARALGQDIVTYDPHHSDEAIPDGVDRVDNFIDLFDKSDAVSIHAPLNKETRNAISRAELEALGEKGVIINTARGGIIDEAALVEALEDGVIAGAGLDNFESEPPGADHPLCGREDVLLTPHVGGVTDQALARMIRGASANVRTVYDGGIPESTVNREAIEREVAQ